MAKAVGIDLGTTNSVIAVWEGGEPSVVPNSEGNRTTPSVVAFTDTGERLVGQLARRQAILNPKGTIYSAKRFIGRHFDEIPDEAKAVAYDVVPGENGEARFKVRDKLYAPEEISALVLRKLADDAPSSWGSGSRRRSSRCPPTSTTPSAPRPATPDGSRDWKCCGSSTSRRRPPSRTAWTRRSTRPSSLRPGRRHLRREHPRCRRRRGGGAFHGG